LFPPTEISVTVLATGLAATVFFTFAFDAAFFAAGLAFAVVVFLPQVSVQPSLLLVS